jgi:glycine/D-amino acid oxidase-like deaminating enzyme
MLAPTNVVVVGGGCLGAAAAIAVKRRLLGEGNTTTTVTLVEKSVVGSGLSARHSGIVRAANADPTAAALAHRAAKLWRNLEQHWGVHIPVETVGALWIAKANAAGDNPKWQALARELADGDIAFNKLTLAEARDVCPSIVKLNDGEVYYHEPGALQIDPSAARSALYQALQAVGVTVREKTSVVGFRRAEDGTVNGVVTNNGQLPCSHIVNACGPWSPAVFASLELNIPVSTEAVNVVNWITSQRDVATGMPIIADYVNLAYFRLWRDGEIHMHQPRKRNIRETARAFAESPLAVIGADFVNDPTNQALGYSQIKLYEDMSRRRFNSIDQTVYGSGYRSYFDITPDLKFILGPDPRMPNVIHCLGSGQAFKYAPVFGEIMADFVTGGTSYASLATGFSIGRFDATYMRGFWDNVVGNDNSLAFDAVAL